MIGARNVVQRLRDGWQLITLFLQTVLQSQPILAIIIICHKSSGRHRT